MEVLRYLALGWDNGNIAAELGVSPHTVRNHATNLRRKLDVRSRLEAVIVAERLGAVEVPTLSVLQCWDTLTLFAFASWLSWRSGSNTGYVSVRICRSGSGLRA